MTETTEILKNKYRAMYRGMIEKDVESLTALLDESFVLEHMTGMRQNRDSFLRYLKNGTLNYYSEVPHEMTAKIDGENAHFIGKSRVNAAVFGGSRHTWSLQLDITFRFKNGEWLICEAVASTW